MSRNNLCYKALFKDNVLMYRENRDLSVFMSEHTHMINSIWPGVNTGYLNEG